MRLNTKEKREAARVSWYREGDTVIDMPEIQFYALLRDKYEKHYTLIAWQGTAGKPYHHYYYRSEESRDKALAELIQNRENLIKHQAERKAANKGKLSGSAATAAVIKARLQKEFLGVKFSVKSSRFSMGNSVDVHWTDGPLYSQVNDIIKAYQYGSFNSYEDTYEYNGFDEAKMGCPGAKYISASRELSPEYREQLNAFMAEYWPGLNHYDRYIEEKCEKAMLGIKDPDPEPEPLPEPVVTEPEPPQDCEPIEPLKVETLPEPVRVYAAWPRLNKCCWLAEYTEQLENPNYNEEATEINEVILLAHADYERFTRRLLDDFEWLRGKGGSMSTYDIGERASWQLNKAELEAWRAGSYTLALLVTDGLNKILVDPEGFGYARYVGFLLDDAAKWRDIKPEQAAAELMATKFNHIAVRA